MDQESVNRYFDVNFLFWFLIILVVVSLLGNYLDFDV